MKVGYKVVKCMGHGQYHSLVEAIDSHKVYYTRGMKSQPNVGAPQFLCAFETLAHAVQFTRAIFPVTRVRKQARLAILQVAIHDRISLKRRNAMLRVRPIPYKKHLVLFNGQIFCRACTTIKRIA